VSVNRFVFGSFSFHRRKKIIDSEGNHLVFIGGEIVRRFLALVRLFAWKLVRFFLRWLALLRFRLFRDKTELQQDLGQLLCRARLFRKEVDSETFGLLFELVVLDDRLHHEEGRLSFP